MAKTTIKTIILKFPKRFYDGYKDDCEQNIGKKLTKREVIKIMLEDLDQTSLQ
jgi:RNase H-fold protein (predicted Holliday junction resolvase)